VVTLPCASIEGHGHRLDGGYAEYMIAPASAVAAIPDELPAEEAGPFMCAGVTSSTRCEIQARELEMFAVHASVGSATSEFNTPGRWV